MHYNTSQHMNGNTCIEISTDEFNPLHSPTSYNITNEIINTDPITLQVLQPTSHDNTSIFWARLKLVEFLQNLVSKYASMSEIKSTNNFNLTEMYKIQTMREFHQKYRIGAIIGEGGDGTVHNCTNNKHVAIKKINMQFMSDIYTFDKLSDSFQELQLLQHTKIIKLHGLYYDYITNIIYKVYDKLNADLSQIMYKLHANKIALSEPQTRRLLKVLCEKIRILHNNNYIHCDVKPDNILFGNNTWNIIDFDRVKYARKNTQITSTFCGTLGFTAPELLYHGGPNLNIIDNKIDIFCLGLLIIYCINGGHLGCMEVDRYARDEYNFAAKNSDMTTMTSIFNEYYYKLYVCDDGMAYLHEIYRLYSENKISPLLCDLLHKMLIKTPSNRLNITAVLNDEWFNDLNELNADSADMIWINGEYVNFYTALMDEATENEAIKMQQNRLQSVGNEEDFKNVSFTPQNSTELLNGSTSYVPGIADMDKLVESECDLQQIMDKISGIEIEHEYISLSSGFGLMDKEFLRYGNEMLNESCNETPEYEDMLMMDLLNGSVSYNPREHYENYDTSDND